jgi:hypothetical protein
MRAAVRSLALGALAMAIGQIQPVRAEEIGWTKAFELTGPPASFVTVGASAEGWMAAGAEIIVVSRNGRIESTREPGRTILRLASTGDGLFGLGLDQLILHFDGGRWVDEHLVPPSSASTRRQRIAAILYGARVFGSGNNAVTAAFGPWSVLIRGRDHTWTNAPKNERYRLNMLAQTGPDIPRPAGCALAAWLWLSDDEGWFTCHDGRSFRHGAGGNTPTGRVPGTCDDAGEGIAVVGKDLYLLCGGNVWRSSHERWDRVPAPKDIQAIAGGPTCLYAVTNRSVWASCAKLADKSKM